MSNPNIASRLVVRAALHPDRLAIIDRTTRVTFAELATRVAQVAGGLQRAGVRSGDRVLVFVPMSVNLYVTLLGTLHAGAVAVFVDAWANRRRLEAAVRTAGPVAFIGSRSAHLLRLFSGEIRRIPRAFTPASAALKQGGGLAVAEVTAAWPALVTFTTGTTGAPKAAGRSHGFLIAQHEALSRHLGPQDDDVDMPSLPVFVLNNLASGVTSVIPDADPRRPANIHPERVHAQMLRHGVTTSSGSPAFYDRLASWCEERDVKLPLRALFTGGAPVFPPLARRLRDTVAGTAHIVYGSTEAEPIAGIAAEELVALSPQGEGLCVGQPVESIRLRLVRPFDDAIELGVRGWREWDVDDGNAGELIVAGAHVLSGYLNDPEAERRNKIRDGMTVWHRTGDAARMDAEGRLWLLGRVRERVVQNGQVWWPLPAELRALTVPGVSHAAYVGMPDAQRRQRAVLCAETARGRGGNQPLTDALRTAVAPWPVDDVCLLRRIPRDPRHASKTDVEALRVMIG